MEPAVLGEVAADICEKVHKIVVKSSWYIHGVDAFFSLQRHCSQAKVRSLKIFLFSAVYSKFALLPKNKHRPFFENEHLVYLLCQSTEAKAASEFLRYFSTILIALCLQILYPMVFMIT